MPKKGCKATNPNHMANLRTPTHEEAVAMGHKGGTNRGKNIARRKLMSEIYADFLTSEFDINAGGSKRRITGAEFVNETMKRIIARGDRASVSLLRELREGTEGNKVNTEMSVKFQKEMESSEERKKLFDSLIGGE